jgi:2-polyprenyl-3-methyl-5-hydroxy-6-metoxy-1,4-benzoquinol methylase
MADDIFTKLSLTFDWETRLKREMPLILDEISHTKGKRVLDIGGGIGMHSLYLQEKGYDVTLLDKSSECINQAKNFGVKNAITGDFSKVLGFKEKFDFIICLGNVISAIKKKDFESFAENLFRSLNPWGRMFFQGLNFDNISTSESFVIASEIKEDVYRLRFIEPYDKDLALFHYVETDLKTSDVKITKKVFNAHLKNDINKSLSAAGFEAIAFYGDYTKSDFLPDKSRDVIFTCLKK